MQRLVTSTIMLIALLAFCAPSLARGLEAVAAPSDDVVVTLSEGGAVLVPPKCKQSGGKRFLPCHPDLGVLAPGMVVPGRMAIAVFGLAQARAAWGRGPDAELPPPRLS